MTSQQQDIAGSLASTMITATVAMLPDEFMSYALKIGSVFLLAVVAEIGRRLVGTLWKAGRKP